MTGGDLEQRFLRDIRSNRLNREILARLSDLGLKQGYLVAGCLVQTIWNALSDRPPESGIKDYDIFYYDDRDLSWEAEDAVIRHADSVFGDLGVLVELRNQARVHLWYEQHFGVAYPRLASSRDGIDRFLVPCTCVGVRPQRDGKVELYAPYELVDLYAGVLRPNKVNDQPGLFAKKAASYQARWPFLKIVTA
jgi:uncharacterized protein